MERVDIKSLSLSQLTEYVKDLGLKSFNAKQIYIWLHQKNVHSFEEMTNISKQAREQLAAECGKNVTGSIKVDFLCNKTQTTKKLQDIIPEDTEHVVVISCGLGVQTVADLEKEKLPVYAAANTLNYTGHHGIRSRKISKRRKQDYG